MKGILYFSEGNSISLAQVIKLSKLANSSTAFAKKEMKLLDTIKSILSFWSCVWIRIQDETHWCSCWRGRGYLAGLPPYASLLAAGLQPNCLSLTAHAVNKNVPSLVELLGKYRKPGNTLGILRLDGKVLHAGIEEDNVLLIQVVDAFVKNPDKKRSPHSSPYFS